MRALDTTPASPANTVAAKAASQARLRRTQRALPQPSNRRTARRTAPPGSTTTASTSSKPGSRAPAVPGAAERSPAPHGRPRSQTGTTASERRRPSPAVPQTRPRTFVSAPAGRPGPVRMLRPHPVIVGLPQRIVDVLRQRDPSRRHRLEGRRQTGRIGRRGIGRPPRINLNKLDGDCALRAGVDAGRFTALAQPAVAHIALAHHATLFVELRHAVGQFQVQYWQPIQVSALCSTMPVSGIFV